MSLAIYIDKVVAVLLPDGEWHEIELGSFDCDAYEFMEGNTLIFGGGQDKGVPATGATWRDSIGGTRCACPISSILAVRILVN